MTDIAIYVEGGGDNIQQKTELRQGLDALLRDVKSRAQAKRHGWKLVPCGGRNATYDAFVNALRSAPAAVNVLLVDSEEAIADETGDRMRAARARVDHLTQRDGWNLTAADPERIHLMVQCMEAWIVADADALQRFYGQHFARNALPARDNLEGESKRDVCGKLDRATADRRMTKGRYSKIKHASLLLQRLDPTKIVQRCPRFGTFTRWLTEAIDAC